MPKRIKEKQIKVLHLMQAILLKLIFLLATKTIDRWSFSLRK